MRYVLRRLGFYLLAAWASLTMNFVIPRLAPGDPATAMFARFEGRISPEALVALKTAFGFTDAPWHVQYFTYLKHLLTGDLGLSYAYYPSPVSEVIGTGLLWTLGLAGCAVIISFAVGTMLGVLAAWNRGGWLDSALAPALAFLGAFPYFWLAMLALYLFGFGLGWFPLRHAYSHDVEPGATLTFLADVGRHAVLPATSIVVATLGGWMLSMRNTMVAVLGTDTLRLAHAKGLPPRQVMLRYAARNALLPNVTGFGMALGFVLSGSLLTEIVFSYPGTGYLLILAVRNQDYPLMQGLFLVITLAVLAANFAVDLLCLWLDPRTRAHA
ncbi:ABC transporter permease [Myxococcus sp. CA051A]|uniref:ABC transporter permease n=1 Tax=Myxococcus llanfairpwllgwyngyllgogerychwyrndrobwllllantysiliogogogochensis TaxID=2590453 RepID=A0A540WXY9_9BACT|nr:MULTISPECIES: ABC transporter permease [Myxococcus]NTX03211.1 ABC transporter permease [Myxococcus sp. CA040A]NTX11624.1 ABC transporter permease [Myxococcus sp. CA056]NTX34279.1 ABC transporter permease [Myxococcus sp. CA033]NTX52726.1 ABC transporter permease [Myxococcus sp. CA039A]NTX60892.1 ABC transporter permease [Myxococcus sp. CA051A]